ncbi:MAG: hypothetical protein IKC35_00550 [Clostridia bacterium]|nr:hypothetical protein [Clostridia bacterium]
MIIGAIIRGIKTVIDAIAKAVAWLLLAFGLWVPLLYSLIFLLVVVLFLDVPLASTSTVYFTGLFISFIGALWFSMARSANKAKQRQRKKSVGYNVAEVKKKNKDVVPIEENQPQIDDQPKEQAQGLDNQQPAPNQYPQPNQYIQPQQFYQPSQPQYYQPPQYAPNQYAQPQPQYYQPPQYAPNQYAQPQPHEQYNQPTAREDYNGGRNYTNESNYRDSESSDYANRYNERRYDRQVYDRRDYGERTESREYNDYANRPLANETPRIFRLREDPDMLVYEYTDRLDYYKRTWQGNVFVRRKFKR